MISYNGYFDMSFIDWRTLKNSLNVLGSYNFQVTEKISETIKACGINRNLCNFIDVVSSYLYCPKPDRYFFLKLLFDHIPS